MKYNLRKTNIWSTLRCLFSWFLFEETQEVRTLEQLPPRSKSQWRRERERERETGLNSKWKRCLHNPNMILMPTTPSVLDWRRVMTQHNIQYCCMYSDAGGQQLLAQRVHFITTIAPIVIVLSGILSPREVNERAEAGHRGSWWGSSPGSSYLWGHRTTHVWSYSRSEAHT